MQVDGGARLEVDDEVNFSAGVIAQTGAYKATGVSLLMTAAERSQNRELGQVQPTSSSTLASCWMLLIDAIQNWAVHAFATTNTLNTLHLMSLYMSRKQTGICAAGVHQVFQFLHCAALTKQVFELLLGNCSQVSNL